MLSFEARHDTEIVVWVDAFAAKLLGFVGRSRSAALAWPGPIAKQTATAARIPRYRALHRPMSPLSSQGLDRQLP
jgi:hypothetical protein